MTDRIQSVKPNLSATSAPAATDDVDLGYGVGSLWFDSTNDLLHVCLDATADTAVWTRVAGASEMVPAGTTVTEATTGHTTDGATDNEFIDFDNASAATLTLDQGTAGHVVFASNRQNTVAAAAGSGVTLLGHTTTATTAAGDLLIARWLTATDVFVTVH